MSDRFDFEQQIMDCWSVCEDLKTITKIYDLRQLSEDQLMNALIGMEALYQMKFEILFDMFERLIKEGKLK